MRAEVKEFYSPDLDWQTEVPDGTACFGLLLQVFVGPAGEDASESFDLTVCTPSFMEGKVSEIGIVDGRHHLFVSCFDRNLIESYIRRRVESIYGRDWNEVALKVSRLGKWEFEDYSH
ncbi:Imm8 family immunity protein [Streptosporangium sandarakinum]|uniref:Imm8 family immunity protein n=1 Tax=Streptosporangium sandarakinum TaxID=1260955 RepID=UPI003D936C13